MPETHKVPLYKCQKIKVRAQPGWDPANLTCGTQSDKHVFLGSNTGVVYYFILNDKILTLQNTIYLHDNKITHIDSNYPIIQTCSDDGDFVYTNTINKNICFRRQLSEKIYKGYILYDGNSIIITNSGRIQYCTIVNLNCIINIIYILKNSIQDIKISLNRKLICICDIDNVVYIIQPFNEILTIKCPTNQKLIEWYNDNIIYIYSDTYVYNLYIDTMKLDILQNLETINIKDFIIQTNNSLFLLYTNELIKTFMLDTYTYHPIHNLLEYNNTILLIRHSINPIILYKNSLYIFIYTNPEFRLKKALKYKYFDYAFNITSKYINLQRKYDNILKKNYIYWLYNNNQYNNAIEIIINLSNDRDIISWIKYFLNDKKYIYSLILICKLKTIDPYLLFNIIKLVFINTNQSSTILLNGLNILLQLQYNDDTILSNIKYNHKIINKIIYNNLSNNNKIYIKKLLKLSFINNNNIIPWNQLNKYIQNIKEPELILALVGVQIKNLLLVFYTLFNYDHIYNIFTIIYINSNDILQKYPLILSLLPSTKSFINWFFNNNNNILHIDHIINIIDPKKVLLILYNIWINNRLQWDTKYNHLLFRLIIKYQPEDIYILLKNGYSISINNSKNICQNYKLYNSLQYINLLIGDNFDLIDIFIKSNNWDPILTYLHKSTQNTIIWNICVKHARYNQAFFKYLCDNIYTIDISSTQILQLLITTTNNIPRDILQNILQYLYRRILETRYTVSTTFYTSISEWYNQNFSYIKIIN